jgi:hypothetical protein
MISQLNEQHAQLEEKLSQKHLQQLQLLKKLEESESLLKNSQLELIKETSRKKGPENKSMAELEAQIKNLTK